MKVNTHKRARTVELTPGGARTSIKFDDSTWAAVDLVAERKGMKWQDLARNIIAAHPQTNNKAGAIRTAVTDELLGEIANSQDRYSPPDISHPMLDGLHVMDDAVLLPELKAARIEYECDFGPFVLHAGYRAQDYGGQPALFIENKMRGELSIIFTQTEIQSPAKEKAMLNDNSKLGDGLDAALKSLDQEIGDGLDAALKSLDQEIGDGLDATLKSLDQEIDPDSALPDLNKNK